MSYKFNKKQLQALSMMASGISSVEISNMLKLRRGTIANWQQIPEFIQEYNRLMEEVRLGFKNKIAGAINTTIESVIYQVGNKVSEPKRIDALINVLKTLDKSFDNEKR